MFNTKRPWIIVPPRNAEAARAVCHVVVQSHPVQRWISY
jgi:hypothetical protein